MTFVVDGTNGLTFPNSTTQASASKVLQVVNVKTSTGVTNTSAATYADTGLTATITPSSATSKILVLISQNGLNVDTGARGITVLLQKNSSTISNMAQFFGYGLAQFVSGVSLSYLDSPATTSALTYKTVFKLGTGSATAYVQDNACESTITLMEIAA